MAIICCLSSTSTYLASALMHSNKHSRSDILLADVFISWEAPHMLSETLPLQTCWVCWSWDGAAVTQVRNIAARAFFMLSSGGFLRSYYLEKISNVKDTDVLRTPPAIAIYEKAFELMKRFKVTFYDAAYRAVAINRSGTLLTADGACVRRTSRASHVQLLMNWSAARLA